MAKSPAPFGDKIRRWRRDLDMTLVDVADAVGISVAHLSDIERGRRNPATEDMVRRIAKVLGHDSDVAFLLSLAALQRRTVEITIPSSNQSPEFAEALCTLARRCDNGEIDAVFIERLVRLVHRKEEK